MAEPNCLNPCSKVGKVLETIVSIAVCRGGKNEEDAASFRACTSGLSVNKNLVNSI